METFITEYAKQLTDAVSNHPDEYHWPVSYVPTVVSKMKDAITTKTFNKDGRAFRQTCKSLGIPHTYKAIYHFIDNHI